MPARTFFSMLREGRDYKQKELAFFLRELVHISATPAFAQTGDLKYTKNLVDHYSRSITGQLPESHQTSSGPVFKADDPMAGKILLDIARQKMRLEGLH